MKPTKMEQHRLEEIRGALRERPRTTVARWGNATVYDLMAHIAALEAEAARHTTDVELFNSTSELLARQKIAADEVVIQMRSEAEQARERVLDEVLAESSRLKGEIANRVTGNDQDAMLGSLDALEERVRAMKSKPAQEATTPIEMASEENGLLPKRRREHEYGEDKPSHFGSWVADCVRPRCHAFRVKNRTKTSTAFRQTPGAPPTDEPGPCEVEP